MLVLMLRSRDQDASAVHMGQVAAELTDLARYAPRRHARLIQLGGGGGEVAESERRSIRDDGGTLGCRAWYLALHGRVPWSGVVFQHRAGQLI